MNNRRTIRYVNGYGLEVYMTDDPPFVYLNSDGFDSMKATPSTTKSPNQLGVTSLGNDIDERPITIRGAIIGADEEELERNRRQLIRTFSPTIKGTLEAKGNTYEISCRDCEVISTPRFADQDYISTNQIIQEFQVSIIVPSGFLTDKESVAFDLSQVEPLIEFPFEVLVRNLDHPTDGNVYPPGDWFEVGTLSSGNVVYDNDGDTEIPVIIQIKGPVRNPRITNDTTGKFIEVNVPIQANETMFIDTSFSNTSVVIRDEEGKERNAFNHIALESDFWSVIVGENSISFDAEEGNDTANVLIKFNREWIGV